MGSKASKEEKAASRRHSEIDLNPADFGRVYDLSRMYYDNDGNVRVSRDPRDRMAELRMILALDDHMDAQEPEEGEEENKSDKDEGEEKKATEPVEEKTWYIIDSRWVRKWLNFVKQKSSTTPQPGRITQTRLVTVNREEMCFKARGGLKPAAPKFEGSYRRVCKAVWDKYVELYGFKGPVITVSTKPYDDTANWEISLDGFTEALEKANKLRDEAERKRQFGFRSQDELNKDHTAQQDASNNENANKAAQAHLHDGRPGRSDSEGSIHSPIIDEQRQQQQQPMKSEGQSKEPETVEDDTRRSHNWAWG